MEVAEGYSIAYRGLKNGTHEFRFEVGKPLFEAFESSEIKDGRCVVEVTLERGETMLTAAARWPSSATAVWKSAGFPCIIRDGCW